MRYLLALLLTHCVWAAPSDRLIFAVERMGDNTFIDPIAFWRGGEWVQPAPGPDPVSMGKQGLQFIERYYSQGTRYNLVGGGQVRLNNSDTARALAQEYANGGSGAWSMAADAAAPNMARTRGLALDFEISASNAHPKPVDKRQRFDFLSAFKKGPGKSVNWRSRARVTELVHTDLDHDGKLEWVGTLQGGNADDRSGSLLVLGPKGQVLLTRTGPAQSIDYLDQVDIDGDGVDELFFRQNGEGGYSFTVFQRLKGAWKEVYTGGGGGC